jgi:hypothetical protein
MGLASGLVALLLASLASLFQIAATVSDPNIALSVQIRQTKVVKAAESSPPEQLVAEELVELPPAAVPLVIPEPVRDAPPPTDWRAIAAAEARDSVADAFRQEESRALLWRRTHSVMFQPGDDFVLQDEEPLLADFRFIYRSRVVGLGLNIGRCFVGIPIAGVPVEQRSGAITIFVCGQDS